MASTSLEIPVLDTSSALGPGTNESKTLSSPSGTRYLPPHLRSNPNGNSPAVMALLPPADPPAADRHSQPRSYGDGEYNREYRGRGGGGGGRDRDRDRDRDYDRDYDRDRDRGRGRGRGSHGHGPYHHGHHPHGHGYRGRSRGGGGGGRYPFDQNQPHHYHNRNYNNNNSWNNNEEFDDPNYQHPSSSHDDDHEHGVVDKTITRHKKKEEEVEHANPSENDPNDNKENTGANKNDNEHGLEDHEPGNEIDDNKNNNNNDTNEKPPRGDFLGQRNFDTYSGSSYQSRRSANFRGGNYRGTNYRHQDRNNNPNNSSGGGGGERNMNRNRYRNNDNNNYGYTNDYHRGPRDRNFERNRNYRNQYEEYPPNERYGYNNNNNNYNDDNNNDNYHNDEPTNEPYDKDDNNNNNNNNNEDNNPNDNNDSNRSSSNTEIKKSKNTPSTQSEGMKRTQGNAAKSPDETNNPNNTFNPTPTIPMSKNRYARAVNAIPRSEHHESGDNEHMGSHEMAQQKKPRRNQPRRMHGGESNEIVLTDSYQQMHSKPHESFSKNNKNAIAGVPKKFNNNNTNNNKQNPNQNSNSVQIKKTGQNVIAPSKPHAPPINWAEGLKQKQAAAAPPQTQTQDKKVAGNTGPINKTSAPPPTRQRPPVPNPGGRGRAGVMQPPVPGMHPGGGRGMPPIDPKSNLGGPHGFNKDIEELSHAVQVLGARHKEDMPALRNALKEFGIQYESIIAHNECVYIGFSSPEYARSAIQRFQHPHYGFRQITNAIMLSSLKGVMPPPAKRPTDATPTNERKPQPPQYQPKQPQYPQQQQRLGSGDNNYNPKSGTVPQFPNQEKKLHNPRKG